MLGSEHVFRNGKARPRLATLAAAALLAVSLSACGSDDDSPPESPDASVVDPQATDGPDSEPGDNSNGDESNGDDDAGGDALDDHAQSVVAAGRTAEEAVPGSRVIQIDLDDGRWEVDVATDNGVEHELTISPDGAEVTQGPDQDNTDTDDRRQNQDRLNAADLDHADAVRAVAEAAPDGQIDELNLDDENGRVIWEVELTDGREFHVDAASGEVQPR